jgi:formiminoglutamase
LKPVRPPDDIPRRSDDPRLCQVIESWNGESSAFRPGRPVLLGFPEDKGVRRNGGRAGASKAPDEVRRWLYRLSTWDPKCDRDLSLARPLDLGNLVVRGTLEESQVRLAGQIEALLRWRVVPIVLGGGHEATFGVYEGYQGSGRTHAVGIINLDAHLDVRPTLNGRGHSGSSFRQAMEHDAFPLPGHRYVCLGVQPHAVSKEHWHYVQQRGCVIRLADELRPSLQCQVADEIARLAADGCTVHLTIDADVVCTADVPGVSAPNPAGLPGKDIIAVARLAGQSPHVSSLDVVELNPRFDRDGQSTRWGAVVIWNFLIGLLGRASNNSSA